MLKITIYTFLLVILFSSCQSKLNTNISAEKNYIKEEPLTIGSKSMFSSKIMGEDRPIIISLPQNYTESNADYPVLYLTDGLQNIWHTIGTVEVLTRTGSIPPIIIVGIESTNRDRDFSPTVVEKEGGSYFYDLIYNGQTILAKGKFMSLSKEITLELNSENLIHKMSRIDSYATFDYDLNGNLTKVKDYDLNDTLLNEYEIKYDQNPNPFYGQLKSTYLVGFIELFNLSSHLGLSYIRTYGFNSFYFPYFKNNIISIEEITSTAPYKFIIENEFIYDSQNYPIIIESTLGSSTNINYEIEYN